MDVPRQNACKRKTVRRTLLVAGLLLAAGGLTYGVSRLQPALPSIESGSIFIDTVKRGPMLRQVRGNGSLVPEDVLWVSAQTDGRVEKIFVQAGTPVTPGMPLMELSNPALTEAMVGAQFDLKQAEAAYTDLDVTLQGAKFDKEAAAAQVASDYQQAKIKADRDRKLGDLGLIPALDLKLSVTQAHELELRNQIEEKRLGIIDRSADAQLAAQLVKIEQLRAMYELKKEQVAQLNVRASVAGVLQQLGNPGANGPALEVGQNVAAGGILARIARQDRLKAQVRVIETEARDLALGQAASIDTRNGIIPGKVARIDPGAVNGTVLVDIVLTGTLPAGARPDLSVDGTIDIEHLGEVLSISRPTVGQPDSTVTLFRVDPDGRTASRTPVKLGRASVNTVEILGGLAVGDKIILSDMSAQDSHDRVRLN